jgi:small subunit ribosomal protein S4
VNIPSYQLRPGDSVGVREKSKSLEAVVLSLNAARSRAEWLDWDNASFSGKLINLPARELIPENIKEQLIVELYSK